MFVIFIGIIEIHVESYIAKVRNFYQLTQADLAQMIGTTRSKISMLEGSRRSSTSVYLNNRFILLDTAMRLSENLPSEIQDDSSRNKASDEKPLEENKLTIRYLHKLKFKLYTEQYKLDKVLELNAVNMRAKLILEDILKSLTAEELANEFGASLNYQILLKAKVLRKNSEERIEILQANVAGLKVMIEQLEKS
jgi:transcriptional regulator with XRE-family HTH domain